MKTATRPDHRALAEALCRRVLDGPGKTDRALRAQGRGRCQTVANVARRLGLYSPGMTVVDLGGVERVPAERTEGGRANTMLARAAERGRTAGLRSIRQIEQSEWNL
jgi:hypothetical protein